MHRKEVSIIHLTIAQRIASRVDYNGEIDVATINTILKVIYHAPKHLCMRYIRALVNDGLLIPNHPTCWRKFKPRAGLIKDDNLI